MTKEFINKDIKLLEEKIDYTFLDKDLLLTALTHTSYINEQGPSKGGKSLSNDDRYLAHNERLEFLGDAVLEILISEELFNRYPSKREGVLTHQRSNLVNEPSLALLAKELGIAKALRLGKGEEGQGGRERASLLSDAFEALLAAMFLDAKKQNLQDPLAPVRALVKKLYAPLWQEEPKQKESKDYKTLLQELTQSVYKETPKYALISTSGPKHKQIFTIELHLPNGEILVESGQSKRDAEQKAAAKALDKLAKK